ncbi:hypothetical protein E4T56_gene19078 [Termitomyces sp. T112]|nr:hypothetical protein E4T56_gene19078 [Termitomyces sp. T112]
MCERNFTYSSYFCDLVDQVSDIFKGLPKKPSDLDQGRSQDFWTNLFDSGPPTPSPSYSALSPSPRDLLSGSSGFIDDTFTSNKFDREPDVSMAAFSPAQSSRLNDTVTTDNDIGYISPYLGYPLELSNSHGRETMCQGTTYDHQMYPSAPTSSAPHMTGFITPPDRALADDEGISSDNEDIPISSVVRRKNILRTSLRRPSDDNYSPSPVPSRWNSAKISRGRTDKISMSSIPLPIVDGVLRLSPFADSVMDQKEDDHLPAHGRLNVCHGTKRKAEEPFEEGTSSESLLSQPQAKKHRHLGPKVSAEIIDYHLKHNKEYNFRCPLCPKITSSRGSDFMRHIRSHGEASHQCTYCGARLSRPDALKRHQLKKHQQS